MNLKATFNEFLVPFEISSLKSKNNNTDKQVERGNKQAFRIEELRSRQETREQLEFGTSASLQPNTIPSLVCFNVELVHLTEWVNMWTMH